MILKAESEGVAGKSQGHLGNAGFFRFRSLRRN